MFCAIWMGYEIVLLWERTQPDGVRYDAFDIGKVYVAIDLLPNSLGCLGKCLPAAVFINTLWQRFRSRWGITGITNQDDWDVLYFFRIERLNIFACMWRHRVNSTAQKSQRLPRWRRFEAVRIEVGMSGAGKWLFWYWNQFNQLRRRLRHGRHKWRNTSEWHKMIRRQSTQNRIQHSGSPNWSQAQSPHALLMRSEFQSPAHTVENISRFYKRMLK